MSEVFPLERQAIPGTKNDVPGNPLVEIAERRPASFVEITLWSPTAKLPKAVAKVAGCKGMPEPGRTASAPGHLIMFAGPGRYFVVGQEGGLAERLAAVVPVDQGAVVELSHGRAGLRISGASAETVLQKGFAFDLSSRSFPPGATTTGAIHHMAVTIVRMDVDTFDVFVMSSLAGSIWHWVTDAAFEFGWTVTSPIS